MGVWIETEAKLDIDTSDEVTPFVGVWIETNDSLETVLFDSVTPFVGVWIETLLDKILAKFGVSHPSWVCGLKLPRHNVVVRLLGHTLRGCVD